MSVLEGKCVLFFSQYFFGYEKKISKVMQTMGAEVLLYDEMSVKKPLERAILKLNPQLFHKKTRNYYFSILKELMNKNVDYVFFIDCEMPDKSILEQYRSTFTNAKFCLHLWDSISNLKGVNKKFRYFDIISTFDRRDSEEYKIILRPLFFDYDYRSENVHESYKYDVSFIGTIHSDRFKIVKRIISQLDPNRFFVYPYLQSHFIYYFYKFTKPEFWGTKISDFKFVKLDSKTISQIVSESKCVLDIQHPKQTGLTMRTLEMVGMKKKLLTTNIDVSNYDIYNDNNVLIIDRNKPVLKESFLQSEYKNLPDDVYEHYSIDQWVIDVLGE